ncbi:MAG: hypothetical protein HQK76_18430 [Desulfobacterales bacterium]|nr:hypothetical protein [Desulfobacterales bacterium]
MSQENILNVEIIHETGLLSQIANQYKDSTSLIEITTLAKEYETEFLVDEALSERIDNIINNEIEDTDKEDLKDYVHIFQDFYKEFTKSDNAIGLNQTLNSIKIGKALHKMKKMTQKLNLKWIGWAQNNLNFINPRTMQMYMQLAQIPNVEQYAALKQDRILHINSVIKDIKAKDDDDPIGTFLKKHDIELGSNDDKPFDDLKNEVDTAVVIEKSEKKGLSLDRDSVRALIEMSYKFSVSDFIGLKEIQDAGGEPNKSLKKLILNKGKKADVFEKKEKIESFKKVKAKLQLTVEHLLKQQTVTDVELKDIEETMTVLQNLYERILSN